MSNEANKRAERERLLGLETANVLANIAGRVVRLREGQHEQDRTLAELVDPPAEARRRVAQAVTAEQSAWRRRSPARSRWPEVVAFDQRVLELDQRQAALVQQVVELEQQLHAAEEADRQALAGWLGAGEQGPRPLPTAPAVRDELEARAADRDAIHSAREQALAAKVAFITKHRTRLLRTADKETRRAQRRYLELIDELAQQRVEVFENRLATLWIALYPREELATEPPSLIAGGVPARIQAAVGHNLQVAADRIWALLRADADYLVEAQTVAQHAALLGDDPRRDPNGATWVATPEGQEQEREDRQAALERYKREWGRYPA